MILRIAFTIDSVEFTPAVLAGTDSLGGSESACLGLARALAARGHQVHIFATKLAETVGPLDANGVRWHPMAQLPTWGALEDFDVAVALRQPDFLQHLPGARFRVLWGQDLMASEAMKQYIMGLAWTYDAIAYVSAYHRKQWEGWLPELAPLGWVTRNGHDAALAAQARRVATKRPQRIIHISRPERGLLPLLAMWPEVRKQRPEAVLTLCRYSSMYDPQGWGEVCKSFDALVEEVNETVGGIEVLGALGKPALYQAIAESAVMWYPGVASFAETSCIAAIEAQACGTPFVGSWTGALPETVPGGVLIPGDAERDPAYQAASVRAVIDALDGCAHSSRAYRAQVAQGLAHVASYDYATIAAEWEAFLLDAFQRRYAAETPRILQRLDYDDDLMLAKVVAAEVGGDEGARVAAMADRVAAGLEHTAEHYHQFALAPADEIRLNITRHQLVVRAFDGCATVLDLACGNGAIAIMLAQADPARRVVAVDFSAGNIAAARAHAEAVGVADRIEFICAPVWDMAAQQPSAWLRDWLETHGGASAGLFVGEFLEHVADAEGFVETVEAAVAHMGRIVYTVPLGPIGRIGTRHDVVYRAHVHLFTAADLDTIFGAKHVYARYALPQQGHSARGETIGHWLISYRHDHQPTGRRDPARRILTRPMSRITAGLIVNDTTDVRRCLETVWPVVDEIILGDTGCRPGTLEAVRDEFAPKARIVPVGDVMRLPGGFSEARNTVLAAASGEWFLWIDADEMLMHGAALGKYADAVLFHGFVIAQTHLYLDMAPTSDSPVRMFRRRQPIQFYGCIHEQPQWGDCNGDIEPALRVVDVSIAHTGYLTEEGRRIKALSRNLPLLLRDQQQFPDRVLGKLLVLRDHANLALWSRQAAGGALTDTAKHHYTQVVGLFEQHFMDPTHKYHALGRPFYHQALAAVAGSLEIEIGLAAGVNGRDKGAALPTETVWARTPAHARAWLTHRVETLVQQMTPVTLDVTPLGPQPVPVAVRERPVPAREAVAVS